MSDTVIGREKFQSPLLVSAEAKPFGPVTLVTGATTVYVAEAVPNVAPARSGVTFALSAVLNLVQSNERTYVPGVNVNAAKPSRYTSRPTTGWPASEDW